MDYKKIYKPLSVSIVCASLLIHNIGNIVYAEKINIIKGITVETIENKNLGILKPSQESKMPLTWEGFIRKMSIVSDTGEHKILEILKDGNKNYLPLVMTKAQISHNYKTMLEFKHQGRLDTRNYSNLIKRVQAITPRRNYITNEEMDILIKEFNNYSIFQGVIREEMRGKLVDFETDGKVVFDIVTEVGIQRRTFNLNSQSNWKIHNGIYRLVTEGDSLIVIDNGDVFKYGIVGVDDEGLTVNEMKINMGITNVSVGDYIEYLAEEGQAVVLNNLGKPEYRVVKNLNREGIIETYQGNIDPYRYELVTDTGLPTNLKSLKPFDLISIAKDTIIVTTNTKKSDIKLIGTSLILDGIAYVANDLIITDGLYANNAQDWRYKDIITQGEVVSDLEGNPKVVKIDNMEYPGVATGLGISKVKLMSTGEKEYELNPMIRTKIELDKLYNFIILNNEVVGVDELNTVKGSISRLHNNFIQIDHRKYPIMPNTPVIVKEGLASKTESTKQATTDKEFREIMNTTKYQYKNLFYSELLDTYEDEIGNGELDIEFIEMYGNVGLLKVVYNPRHILNRDNYIDETKEITVKSIQDIDNNNILITVSDGTNEAKFTYERYVNLKEGDTVSLTFDRRGNLIRIK